MLAAIGHNTGDNFAKTRLWMDGEGIELDVATLADWVGACTATLSPLVALLRSHVMAAERQHGDDTTAPVLATGRTTTGR